MRLTILLSPKVEWIKGRMIRIGGQHFIQMGTAPLLPANYFTINYGKLGGLTFKFVGELR